MNEHGNAVHLVRVKSSHLNKQGQVRNYQSSYLRRSWREGKKVHKETIANLSALPEHVIESIIAGLAGEQLAPAMRFGDPRVMALFGALCITVTVLGFTNRSFRAQVNHLLGTDYSTNQMSYDLARLCRTGLIERQPRSNIYILTADGQRVALFHTKVHNRLLHPLLAADQPPAPLELRRALATIDQHVRSYIDTARLSIAA